MDFIIQLDHQLFYLINQVLVHPWLDPLMVFITTFKSAFPFFVLLLLWMGYRYRMKALNALMVGLTAVAIVDPLASQILKPQIHRQRPSFKLGDENVRLIVDKQGSPSFPSNHAANSFAAAVGASLVLPPLRIPLLVYAFLVTYSRPYVGVHFPIDVLTGAALGSLIAFFVFKLSRIIEDWMLRRRKRS